MLDSSKMSLNILEELKRYLPKEALDWISLFGDYAHMLDDIIDEKNFQNFPMQLKLQYYGIMLYSSDYYCKMRGLLYPIMLQAHNTYADSLCWETSSVEWKKHFSDVLRCCGNEVIFALVHHYAGYDAMRSISTVIREDAYNRHHDELGKPI